MKNFVLISALCLSACGGGSGSGSPSGASSISPGGIWKGTLTVAGTTTSISGLIDERGNSAFLDGNGNIYRCSGSPTLSANVYAGNCKIFSNSAGAVLSATFNATVNERVSISVTSQNSAGQAGSGTATYDPIYNLTPSFATVAGTYQYTANGGAVTIIVASNGTYSGSDSAGCSETGHFSITDPLFNAYNFTGTIACANGSASISGLSYYTPASNGNPATLTTEYDNGSTVAAVVRAPQQ